MQFDAGVAASASNAFDPHQITFAANEDIITLTDPIGRILDTKFIDVAENTGLVMVFQIYLIQYDYETRYH